LSSSVGSWPGRQCHIFFLLNIYINALNSLQNYFKL
jgi:hypothetical protein